MKKIVFFFTALSGCLCYSWGEKLFVGNDVEVEDNGPGQENDDLEEDDDNDCGGIGVPKDGIANSPSIIKQGINLLEQSTKSL